MVFPSFVKPFVASFLRKSSIVIARKIKNLISNKIFIKFGVWSYSIYLWQQIPFYYGEEYGILRSDNYFLTLVLLACGILMGIISFYIIENPARNYINNKSSKLIIGPVIKTAM